MENSWVAVWPDATHSRDSIHSARARPLFPLILGRWMTLIARKTLLSFHFQLEGSSLENAWTLYEYGAM